MLKYRYWDTLARLLQEDWVLRHLKVYANLSCNPNVVTAFYQFAVTERLLHPQQESYNPAFFSVLNQYVWPLLPRFIVEYGATYEELSSIIQRNRPLSMSEDNRVCERYCTADELAEYQDTMLYYSNTYGVEYPKRVSMRDQSELAKIMYKAVRLTLKRLSAIVKHPKYGDVQFVTIQR